MEIAAVAMMSGFPAAVFVPALVVNALAKRLGVGLFGVHDTVLEFTFDWLIICFCGFAQWYVVLRGVESGIRKLKIRLRHGSPVTQR
jgi:hypothetical protein